MLLRSGIMLYICELHVDMHTPLPLVTQALGRYKNDQSQSTAVVSCSA